MTSTFLDSSTFFSSPSVVVVVAGVGVGVGIGFLTFRGTGRGTFCWSAVFLPLSTSAAAAAATTASSCFFSFRLAACSALDLRNSFADLNTFPLCISCCLRSRIDNDPVGMFCEGGARGGRASAGVFPPPPPLLEIAGKTARPSLAAVAGVVALAAVAAAVVDVG